MSQRDIRYQFSWLRLVRARLIFLAANGSRISRALTRRSYVIFDVQTEPDV